MEQYDEDLKKKHIKYAQKWKRTASLCWKATAAPISPPKTPAWGCTELHSAPALIRWRHLPPSSSLPCGRHPSPAAAPEPVVPTSQQKMSLPGWLSGQRGIRNTTCLSARWSWSRALRGMWPVTWWSGPDAPQSHQIMSCIRKMKCLGRATWGWQGPWGMV